MRKYILVAFSFCIAAGVGLTSSIAFEKAASPVDLADEDRQMIITMFKAFYQAANRRDTAAMLAMYTDDAVIQWYYQGRIQTVSKSKFIEDLAIIVGELKAYEYVYTGPKNPVIVVTHGKVSATASYDYSMAYNGKPFVGSFTDTYEMIKIGNNWKVRRHTYK